MSTKNPNPLNRGINPAQSALTRRQKRTAGKDGGGKQLKRRTRYATVACRTHGKLPSGSGFTIPELRCAIPSNKREQFGGCPQCVLEKREAAKRG